MTVTYIHRDQQHIEADKDLDGCWRIHNGEYWTMSFQDKETAREMCKKLKGIAIGQAYYNQEKQVSVYRNIEQI